MTIDLEAAGRALRERLAGQNFLTLARELAPAGIPLRSEQDMQDTLHDILRRHDAGEDLHVFGYGSLMWNPGVAHSAAFKVKVHGWHRRFCLRCVIGRGTPDTPGLMLALDRGGSCNGMVIRIPAQSVVDEMSLLWRREMSWGSYQARWVTAWADGAPVRAVTFVVDRQHPRYLGGLALHDAARLIDTGHGPLGTCRAYFDATMQRLRELGIRDRSMEQLDLHLAAGRGNPRAIANPVARA